MAYVYKILNIKNGKFYIGSSKDYIRRWYQHKYYLNKNKHQNKYLQNAWNKYGKNNFEFILLEECEDLWKRSTEQKYLNRLKPFVREIGYNISPSAYNSKFFAMLISNKKDRLNYYSLGMDERIEDLEEIEMEEYLDGITTIIDFADFAGFDSFESWADCNLI